VEYFGREHDVACSARPLSLYPSPNIRSVKSTGVEKRYSDERASKAKPTALNAARVLSDYVYLTSEHLLICSQTLWLQ